MNSFSPYIMKSFQGPLSLLHSYKKNCEFWIIHNLKIIFFSFFLYLQQKLLKLEKLLFLSASENLCGVGQRNPQYTLVSWSNNLPTTLIPLMSVLQELFGDDLTWKEMVRIQTFWPHLRIMLILQQRSLRPTDHQGRVMLKLDHVLNNMSITIITIIRR